MEKDERFFARIGRVLRTGSQVEFAESCRQIWNKYPSTPVISKSC